MKLLCTTNDNIGRQRAEARRSPRRGWRGARVKMSVSRVNRVKPNGFKVYPSFIPPRFGPFSRLFTPFVRPAPAHHRPLALCPRNHRQFVPSAHPARIKVFPSPSAARDCRKRVGGGGGGAGSPGQRAAGFRPFSTNGRFH